MRAMLYYPMSSGRSMPEILRLTKALQTADKHHIATPANWEPGDKVIVPAPKTPKEIEKRMQEGYTALGITITMGAPAAGKVCAVAGCDFVMVDNQHGDFDDASNQAAFDAIALGGAMPAIRVQQNDYYTIGRALDRGALGIVVPMVNSAEEAREVVLENRTIEYREDDSHDIRGTFDAILGSRTLAFPTSAAAFKSQLAAWNRQVIFARASKSPGEWKQKANRFGDTYFVVPELVHGTLDKGYEVIASTSDPAIRAALAMFVVAEVHPFSDGNGRTARLMMNLALSAAGLTRLIIPTVYRDDYFSALHALSHSQADEPPFPRIEPYLVMLNRTAVFSRWLDCSSEARMLSALEASQALKQPTQGKLTLPRPPERYNPA